MPNVFASGKWAISICDRCGFQYPLKELQTLVIKTKNVNIKVCQECWEPDQPQLSLGLYPVDDPQSLRDPRPDTTLYANSPSRDIQWGWDPVGLDDPFGLVDNNLVAHGDVGTVTVTTS